MSLEMLGEYSDELLRGSLTRPNTPEDRTERLEELAQCMRPLIRASWHEETLYLEDGLRAAAVIACLPSLSTVAQSESHTRATAVQVSDSLRTLSTRIITTNSLEPDLIKQRGGPRALREANGKMSEIAVLGLFWWGIAHGRWDERMYALPATTAQDSGRHQNQKDSLSLATDIMLRQSDSAYKQRIQVKTSATDIRPNRYHPEVIVVAVSDLMKRHHAHNPRRFLRFLSRDSRYLEDMHNRLDAQFRTAEEELSYYERYTGTN